MKSMYEYLLKDNIKLMKAIFLERQKKNIEQVKDLLRQFNDNSKEILRIKSRRGDII